MSSKMGRPKSDNPKDRSVTVRLDKALDEQLEKYCKQHSIRKAQAIRLGICLLLNRD